MVPSSLPSIVATLLVWNIDLWVVTDAWMTTTRHHGRFACRTGRSRDGDRHTATARRQGSVQRNGLSATTPTAADGAAVRIYSRPSLYDLAFGYREFEQEVDTLLQLHRLATGRDAESVVEVAAGPARHCLALPASVTKLSFAVDDSPEMKTYSESLRPNQPDTFEYLVQDMRHMELPSTVDTAWLLLGSFQHMVTVDDAKQCFQSIHKVLNPNGTFILELPHPNELFSMVDCTTNTWSVPLELSDDASGELNVVWGDADDPFDPLTHIRNATVGFHLKTGEEEDDEQWTDSVPMKGYTVPELYLLAELTGFRVVQLVGALDNPDGIVPIDHEDLAYRLVCVFQKI